VDYFQHIKFFKALGLSDQVIYGIITSLHYEFFKEGDYIFHYDDTGDKFYIMLRGEASVLLPFQLNEDGELIEALRNTEELDHHKLRASVRKSIGSLDLYDLEDP